MVTKLQTKIICVVGAGYVGLPLSRAFARTHNVISFDNDTDKVKHLSAQYEDANHVFTADPGLIKEADFISICVPTPLTEDRRLDMTVIKEALAVVGRNMKRGVVVIVESTVYPGATEEVLKPILEQTSRYECGKDFKLAYSPERINPGDSDHAIEKVTKIVAASDEETLDQVVDLYRTVTPNVFRARDIRTAEAAKLVENAQRDLNIAFVNELSIMFSHMGISTQDVLDAAATKWNFQKLSPGLVGGYCIPAAPYFLAQKAHECGYNPRVILAGRVINDYMSRHVAEMTIKSINDVGKTIRGSRILIMGCTYKENTADTRESPIKKVIQELSGYGVDIFGYDPLIHSGHADLGISLFKSLTDIPKMDCIILAVAHDVFKWISVDDLINIMNPYPVIIDVKGLFDTPEMRNSNIVYKRL